MLPADWTPHRREDGETLGWIRPEGELWIPLDRLGRESGAPMEWLDAEQALEERGLGWLAERWWLDGEPVRIAEVNEEQIFVVTDYYGGASAVGAPRERIELPWPAPEGLSQREPSGFEG